MDRKSIHCKQLLWAVLCNDLYAHSRGGHRLWNKEYNMDTMCGSIFNKLICLFLCQLLRIDTGDWSMNGGACFIFDIGFLFLFYVI